MTSVYLQARLKLKYGQVPAFMDTMTKARPLVERHGWKLIGAWGTVIGNFHEVTHLWQIADADAVPTVLGKLAVDPDVRAAGRRLRRAGRGRGPHRAREDAVQPVSEGAA